MGLYRKLYVTHSEQYLYMMKKPSIKAITVKSLINVLIAIALIVLFITAYNFRVLSTRVIENQALAHAELVKAGLTSHMKAGMMDARAYYLQEIKELHDIHQIQIIRGQPVSSQFGPGNPVWEQNEPDVFASQALKNKTAAYQINEFSLQPTIRAVIPYVASSQGNLNCLGCHQVEEGTVLGAVDLTLDVTAYRNHAALVIGWITAISALALLLVFINTSRTIRNYVQQPLEMLVENAAHAYHSRQPVPTELYLTMEFTNVANEFNMFNNEILAHQEELHTKNLQLLALNDEIESTLRETVYTMGVIEEQRSKETANHTRRVALYSQLLARKTGLSEEETDLVTAASPLHDIGKLGIPDSILFKPDRLTDNERSVMKNHPVIGFEMLKHSKRDILIAAGTIAHEHHERWDGGGYPRALQGEDIHIFGRIVALADVFDALYSPRVYKKAWALEDVVGYIQSERGKHFDPILVDCFLDNIDLFDEIYRQYPA